MIQLGFHKKWIVGLCLILGLLAVDTAIRLFESHMITKNIIEVISIEEEFTDQYKKSLKENGYESDDHQIMAYNNAHKAGAKIYVYKQDTERLFTLPWHRRTEFFKQDAAIFMNSRHQYLSGTSFSGNGFSFGASEIDYQSVTYALIESANDAIPFIDPAGIKGDVVSELSSQIGAN